MKFVKNLLAAAFLSFSAASSTLASTLAVWNFNEMQGTGLHETSNDGLLNSSWSSNVEGLQTNGFGKLEIMEPSSSSSRVNLITKKSAALTVKVLLAPHSTSSGRMTLGFMRNEETYLLYTGLYYDRVNSYIGYVLGGENAGRSVQVFHSFGSGYMAVKDPLELGITYFPDQHAEIFYRYESELNPVTVGIIENTFFVNDGKPKLYFAVDGFSNLPRDNLLIDSITVSVPEPKRWALLLAGLGGMFFVRRRRSTVAL